MLNLSALPIALIYLSEPYTWFEFKVALSDFAMRCCSCCQTRDDDSISARKLFDRSLTVKEKKSKKQKFRKEGLNSFLNSAMNIEFVYLILLGVNNFMENQYQNQKE